MGNVFITAGWFLSPMSDVIIRKKGESEKSISLGDVSTRLLASSGALEGLTVEIPPKSEIPKLYSHGGEEIRFMLKGEIEVEVEGDKYILKEGDMMWHESTAPHRIRNPTDKSAVYFLVNVPPSIKW